MEEKGSSSPSSTCSRWNPTKEQISLLEGLYRQGIRTPTAEEIQQITGKLREYGNIEGKNVFYWFQNHKARQRQRQKQEGLAYFNRFLQSTALPPGMSPSPPPPTCANVLYSPYYMPRGAGVGLYPQHPKVIFPGLVNGRPAAEYRSTDVTSERNLEVYRSSQPPYGCDDLIGGKGGGGIMSHETLQLFPLHPTGVLEERSAGSSFPSTSTESESLEGEGEGRENQPLIINFFDAPRHC